MKATGHIGIDEPFDGMFTQGMVVHETYRAGGEGGNGHWLSPAEVRIEGDGDDRRAVEIATGNAVDIGGIEKMSKSKRNTVDPSEIMESYGADTARWFMLSDSPPDRDVIWTEESVAGAARFVQRVWRLVGEAMAQPAVPPAGSAVLKEASEDATALRKIAHRALASVEDSIRGIRFNVAVAKIYELANAIASALTLLPQQQTAAADRALGAAVRESLEMLVHMLAPMMPHLAEECWAALGHSGIVATRQWPEVDGSLLVEDTITLPVQVNGRKRGELTIATDASQVEVETATLALEAIQRALDGQKPRKIVVVPKRIVNVVI